MLNFRSRFGIMVSYTAVYLINRLLTPILISKSPYDILYGKPPTYNKFKSFECLCYPWLKPYEKSKLHPKLVPSIFLGYSSSKSAYKCYDPSSHHLFDSWHVEFVENIYIHTHSKRPQNHPYLLLKSSSIITQIPKPPLQTQPTLIFTTNPIHIIHLPHKNYISLPHLPFN